MNRSSKLSRDTWQRKPDAFSTRGQLAIRRSVAYERCLRDAIGGRVLVSLLYDGDAAKRLYAPHALFRTMSGGMQMSGTRLSRPDQPTLGLAAEILSIAKIVALRVTNDAFLPDPRFDPASSVFQNGMICSVQT